MGQAAFNVYITACYVDIAYDSDPLYSPQIYPARTELKRAFCRERKIRSWDLFVSFGGKMTKKRKGRKENIGTNRDLLLQTMTARIYVVSRYVIV